MNAVLIIFFAVIGLGLGIAFDIFIIKNYPEDRRKGAYIKTAAVFLLIFLAFAVILVGSSATNSAIRNYSIDDVNAFKNDKNEITVESLTRGFKEEAVKTVNLVALIIAGIFIMILIVYVIRCLAVSLKFLKAKKHEAVPAVASADKPDDAPTESE